MVAHIGLRIHKLLYEEIGNIIAENYQPENVTKTKPTIINVSLL